MIKLIHDKLKSTRGETISETLVSTLIAALAMILFSSMVIASRNVIKSSKQSLEDYYDRTTKMAFRESGVKTEDAEIHFTVPLVYSSDPVDVTLYYNQASDASEENDFQVKSY
ncbi:hypothetical protein UYO_2093 [Lachnospiraceae bacterium JC7]|nr:hypothetical protein UYO_2093 [Lachnospiraceae bacterium JC7]